MSDCVILDTTIPVISLDETVKPVEVESGEEIDEDDDEDEAKTQEDEDEAQEDRDSDPMQYSKSKVMNILFPDEANFHKFGPEIIAFMQEKCDNLSVELDAPGLEISFFEKVIDLDEDSSIFTIDTTPAKAKLGQNDIPRYRASLSEALSNEKPAEAKPNHSPRRALACFNCDGEHNMRDCQQPRNYQKINANRKARGGGKTERYHVDLSQKFGHLRAGHVSSKLRKALGLHKKDLPVHIFRMRQLGYPPGWLEEAKIRHSGINLFGSDGAVVLESEDEDGEVDQVKDKYDPAKVIEYPGFNVDPPEGCYDDARLFDCPPMQEEHKKDTFLENLGVNLAKAYKRRKMNSFPMNDSSSAAATATAVDMDIGKLRIDRNRSFFKRNDCPFSEDEEGEIKENIEFGGRPPLPASDDSIDKSMPPPPAPDHALVVAGQAGEEGPAANPSVNDSLVEFILTRDDEEETAKDTCPVANGAKPTTPTVLESKMMVEGTPLLKSASSFDKLPDGDKWAVGVSDVINFENLPDSVGKYEKMKVLIKKVQEVVKQINSE